MKIRTSVTLGKHEYTLAKAEAQSCGISLAEFMRRAIRDSLLHRESASWMRFAGLVETGIHNSSETIDEIVYGRKD